MDKKEPTLSDHEGALQKQQEKVKDLKNAEQDYETALGLDGSTEEEKATAYELVREEAERLKKLELEYHDILAQSKEVGDINNNRELRIEAYRDHLHFLEDEALALSRKINLFRSTLDNDKLLDEIEKNGPPNWVLEQVGEDQHKRNRVRFLFYSFVVSRIKNGDTVNGEELKEELWQKATDIVTNESSDRPGVKARAGWTPHH